MWRGGCRHDRWLQLAEDFVQVPECNIPVLVKRSGKVGTSEDIYKIIDGGEIEVR